MLNRTLTASFRRFAPSPLARRLDPFEAAVARFVSEAAAKTARNAWVLDAGAGECRYRPQFFHTRYIGLDSAQGDPSWDYSKLDVIGRLEELPFPDDFFDCVLSIVVLEHTCEPTRVLREIRRVLKPGGAVYIVAPYMWEEHQRPRDYFRFTSNGVRLLAQRAGLSVRRLEPVGGFFWQLGRRFIAVLAFVQQGWRWALFPLMAPVFGFLLPLCCYYLDVLDADRAYTLGFICEGRKE